MNPPSSPQPADSLEKRRKQIEKAKAAHLSRQLQTRLQYARLKVDHGWQKQTLNEVENLYFHHYRARIPPPKSALKAEKSTASTMETQSTSELPASTSSEQRSPSLPIPDPSPTLDVPGEDEQTAMDVEPADEGPTASTSGDPSTAAGSAATAPPPQPKLPSPPVTAPSTTQRPPPQRPPAVTKTPPLPLPVLPAQTQILQHPTFLPAAPMPSPTFSASTSRNSSYPQAQSAPLGSRGPSPSQRPSPSMMPSSLPGNSNVALTYDSFWSSHSSTSNSYRSALASATPFAPVGKGDGGMGLQNFGGYAFAMGAPAKLPIPRRPGVPRKRTMPAPAGNMGHGVGAAEGGG